MTRWFRMYTDVLDDPKVQKLPPALFKAWVNLLCLAGRNDGRLPGIEDIAFALRQDEDVTRDMVRDMVERGLLDDEEGLVPHNWSERQFKSDHDNSASERKKAQRQREKSQKKDDVTPDVTDDVTRDNPVMSHPPEQSRTDTEQSRAEHTGTRAQDPKHWEEVQDFLKQPNSLTDWEVDFLHSVKWKPSLSEPQRESLKGIRDKLRSTTHGGCVLPSVKRGTPAFDAWIAHYRAKNGGKPTFHEGRDSLTVISEFPPTMQEHAA
jgi:hypothetical protein